MRILLVEDEKKVASFISKGLEEELYHVDVAKDGREGLSMATSQDYDLIISDVMMPHLTGLQLTEELRKLDIPTPILLLTVKDSIKDKVDGLNIGADDYLTKPFSFEELLARVRALLRRRDSLKDSQLLLDDLKIDLISHRVTRAEKEIILTPKEFSILEYLMRNKNRIISRTKLIEHVYDYHFDPGTNVIDVYINKLRQKIDQDYSKALIHTVRGLGYVIKD